MSTRPSGTRPAGVGPATLARRELLLGVAAASVARPGRAETAPRSPSPVPLGEQPVAIFTKHLQFLDYVDAARAAREAGFDALDVPVRPGGHVLPERVRDDLPRAAEAAREAGLSITMITTRIRGVDSPHARAILETAAGLGIRHYRMGDIRYETGVAPTLEALVPRFRELASLNRELGIRAGYQNHSGDRFGSAVWDLVRVLEAVESPWVGMQYDIRHAVVEGAYSWVRGLELAAPHVHTLVAKDFHWERQEGAWRIRDVPFGQGMVPLAEYVQELRRLGVSAPLSMHFEYPHPDEGRRHWAVEGYGRDLRVLRAALRGGHP